ncbi:MAG: type II toxin-antitoxin system PemK/MazF family toxin [Deltaproteobacteria bacterium]|nr:type II toxin-antitoxin system PemK/MazF family toxin [Deltaproteobacteria bacterium]
MSYDAFDVVVVPFPFTDLPGAKRRPAVVLSGAAALGQVGQHVMAMVTTAGHAPWPLDVPIDDLAAAGLPHPSVVRMKLFTLDHRLVLRRIGALASADAGRVGVAVRRLLGGACAAEQHGCRPPGSPRPVRQRRVRPRARGRRS